MTKYEQKENWFNSPQEWWFFTCKRTATTEFYRDLFPVGSFENEVGKKETYEHTNKGNGFVVYQDTDEKYKTRMIFDDLNLKNLPSIKMFHGEKIIINGLLIYKSMVNENI